ncbi:MAG: hypothetical protein C0390_03050 [Syntrophus sp. (in: bacteria)]|nr:hypothetical protein [Syntrophus sp. (in: bacteria)]
MTHSNAGRYADKHAPGRGPDEKIAAAVRSKAREGELACADAERISLEHGTAMAAVGRTLDLLEVRINRCQLGLFGYATEGKTVLPENPVIPEIEKEIRSRLSEGKLPCAAAWAIAAEKKIPRMKVSSACEALKIKIKPCQLGAF